MRYRCNGVDLFKFGYELFNIFRTTGKPVFLCVGSDKYVSDSLAPIVAEMLKKEYSITAFVYGGLDYNINANNLMEAVNYIETIHPNHPIVLIDATLSENVGDVIIAQGSFAGLGKCLPIRKLGVVSVLGVVGRKVADFNLNSTRLQLVVDMARFIAKGCFLAVNKLDKDFSNINV